ncbi:MAG: glycerate kinase [Lentisphaerae bacterium]|nr:glycerate kinase [Lentisphaerota bacterium]
MERKKIIIAVVPDSFKGSMTALEAALCIERGLKRVLTNVVIRKIPMADGGDGTVQTVVDATGGKLLTRAVRNPTGRRVQAMFGVTGDGKTAVIEMATASGLVLLAPKERNPMITSTYGTGELIRHALDLGVRRILVGIGGSATNDGGMGMARALGIRFVDSCGRDLREGGGALKKLAKICPERLDDRIRKVSIDVACDVDNPLVGPRGAARVYGPQKGATPAMVRELDAGLRQMAKIIKRDLGKTILNVPGSGAAGGLGGGLMAFLGGRLKPGVSMVMDAINLKKRLKGCNLVITGEGRMDGQTAFGKAPAGVAAMADRLGISTIAISGCVGADVGKVNSIGIYAYFSALQEPIEETMLPRRGPAMLEDCAAQIARLMVLNFPGKRNLHLK